MGEGDLRAVRADQVQHRVDTRAKPPALDAGDQRLAGIELDGVGVDVARLVELAVDRHGQRLESAGRSRARRWARLGVFGLLADEEAARSRSAIGGVEAEEVGADGRVLGDLDRELAGLLGGFEGDRGRVGPALAARCRACR